LQVNRRKYQKKKVNNNNINTNLLLIIMGVDFYCGDTTFGCSYVSWIEYRKSIIKSTFKYLNSKFSKDIELYGNLLSNNDDNFIGEGSRYNNYMNVIKQFLEKIDHSGNGIIMTKFGPIEDSILSQFIRLTKDNINVVDALIYFGVGGLFSLCNKTYCEGFYSPGNSYDICKLFDTIKHIIKEEQEKEKEKDIHNDTYLVYNSIYNEDDMSNCLYTVFKTSYETGINVIIC